MIQLGQRKKSGGLGNGKHIQRQSPQNTQEQLAEFVGVSPQAVSKGEMNSFPDASLLPKIAEKLEVSIDELFGLKSENISIYDRILEHIKSVPAEKRFDEMFSIVRAFTSLYQRKCSPRNTTITAL